MQIFKVVMPFVFSFILIDGRSQNVVPNGDFEYYSSCPVVYGELYKAVPWHQATIGNPDYYNSCSNGANVPFAGMGYQFAVNGNAFVGEYAYINEPLNKPNLREYIQSELIDTLKQSHTYQVSFYVSLCDECGYAVNKMGAYLSDTAIYSNDTSYLPFIPQIESTTFLSDTANWMQISGFYQANGGEKYITIGNFWSDTLTDTIHVNNFGYPFAYYYIDSVTVIDCTATGINEVQQVYFNLLQNPVSNSVCFTSAVQLQKAIIFNTLGAVVKVQVFEVTTAYQIDVADLPRGIYFLQVETKDKKRGVKKFVKQ